MIFVPESTLHRASQWCYRGIWKVVTERLRVPEQPPEIKGADDQQIQSFRPAEGFLRYMKLFFWIGLVAIDGLLLIGWLALCFAFPVVGLVLTPVFWTVMILPDIVAYVAIHLRYDTTWYVLSDRSMRIRRGIWSIRETTITYDNIQNVSIRQGPVQRYFGIANVLIETAGGGASASEGSGGGVVGHHGLLEGIRNAAEVRDLILAKWRGSRSVGLGDEQLDGESRTAPFSTEQIELLEGIRDIVLQLRDA